MKTILQTDGPPSLLFCEKCGGRMVGAVKSDGFDVLSGSKMEYVLYRCPKSRWYSVHSEYIYENGQLYDNLEDDPEDYC